MEKKLLYIIPFLILGGGFFLLAPNKSIDSLSGATFSYSSERSDEKEFKTAREKYFRKILVNPKTNSFPEDLKKNEQLFRENLINESLFKSTSFPFTWNEIGPYDVGGRTRAIALDVRNSDVILTGGVSGGIWKSSDNGQTWALKSSPEQLAAVTSIAQDIREGHQDTWYCSTGERSGSAQDQGWKAMYYGNGLFKSTDNGETWTQIEVAGKDYKFDSNLDYVTRIIVNPATGSVFYASNNFGIWKIKDNKSTYVLGKVNDYYYPDVTVNENGTILAFLSEDGKGGASVDRKEPGVYKSTDDGETWNRIPTENGDLPASYSRGVIKFAPSNNNIAYAYIHNKTNNRANLCRINISKNKIENLSDNIPAFTNGYLGAQGAYNMTLAIKPDNEKFLIMGSTLLFRVRDIDTPSSDKNDVWIGGYKHGSYALYPNHHPDCHVSVFDPKKPDCLWSGHDGGLSYTTNISKVTVADDQYLWQSKNNGFNVTQFYTVSLGSEKKDNIYMGGTQDNGSPVFGLNDKGHGIKSYDYSSGDGSCCHIGSYNIVSSSQSGTIQMRNFNLPQNKRYVNLTPPDLKSDDALFIHPFVVEQNDDKVLYVPNKNKLSVNTDISSLEHSYTPSSKNWKTIDIKAGVNEVITTLAVSTKPANIVYCATYSYGRPKIYKIENSNSNSPKITVTELTGSVNRAYPHNISVNPKNSQELIVTLSNYGIKNMFHSIDGGKTFKAVDGNLDNLENTGPSIRSTAILPINNKTYYIAGTSIGLFMTDNLTSSPITWQVIAPEKIGNVVVNAIDINEKNGEIAIGTHGRGIFRGIFDGTVNATKKITSDLIDLNIYPNPTKNVVYIRSNLKINYISLYDLNGKQLKLVANKKEMNLSNLASGSYVLKIETDQQVITKKIIKH